ncbi:MAG TPA: zinc ribbon domain-containing protein [Acidimicrobiia bacterium]|nr:zinc ribbon domain-containing protein [Acidimicrobiia bacterium]
MTTNEPPDANITCPQCGGQVPPMSFCVRCGYSLDDDPMPARRSGRVQFAAAPRERAWAPHVVSSLFPQLPDADMTYFGIALVLGLAVIVGLALGGLYPIALTVAAALMPLLVLLYLVAVDVYEDEPPLVLGLTMAWGALVGVGLGLWLQNIDTPLGPPSFSMLGDGDVLLRVVVVPLVGEGLALAALLVLLRYPRFNDVLDGTTFGAATAVTLIGVQTIVQAWPLVSAGLRPAGESGPWIIRLVEIGVLIPLIWAGAIGALAGAFWLRYRAPVRDRHALGPLGSPLLALVASSLLVVAAPAGLQVLERNPGLIWVAVLAVIAVVLLRRAVHVGLLEEADETADLGEQIQCANCHRPTPRHTFCGQCGIALRALPKPRPAGGAAAPEPDAPGATP